MPHISKATGGHWKGNLNVEIESNVKKRLSYAYAISSSFMSHWPKKLFCRADHPIQFGISQLIWIIPKDLLHLTKSNSTLKRVAVFLRQLGWRCVALLASDCYRGGNFEARNLRPVNQSLRQFVKSANSFGEMRMLSFGTQLQLFANNFAFTRWRFTWRPFYWFLAWKRYNYKI